MEAMKDLAAAVQLCFAVFSLPADLHRSDVAFVGDIGSQLQPILLRLQKAALQCEAVTSDQQLLAATGEDTYYVTIGTTIPACCQQSLIPATPHCLEYTRLDVWRLNCYGPAVHCH